MSDAFKYAQSEVSIGGLPDIVPTPIPYDPEAWRGRIVFGDNQVHWWSDGKVWSELLELPISTPSAIAPVTPAQKLLVRMTPYASNQYGGQHSDTRFEIFFKKLDSYDGVAPDIVFDYNISDVSFPPAGPYQHLLPINEFEYGQEFYWRGLYRAGSVQSRYSVIFAQTFPKRMEDPVPLTEADSQTTNLQMTPFASAFDNFGYYTYEYEIARDALFVDLVVSGDGSILDIDKNGAKGDLRIETSKLEDGIRYFWRARYVASSSESNPSAPDGRFRTEWTSARSFFPTPFTVVMEFDTNAEPSLGLSAALELHSYADKPVTGLISWGDGQTTVINHLGSKVYQPDGPSPDQFGQFLRPNDPTGVSADTRYKVRISVDAKDTLAGIGSRTFSSTFIQSQRKIVAVTAFGQNMGITNLSAAFRFCRNLILLPPQLPLSYDELGNITKRVTNLNEAFAGCSSLTTPNISNWDVTDVTIMWSAFLDCTGFDGPVEKWEPKSCSDFRSAFRGTAINRNINDWAKHIPNVGMLLDAMFESCERFNQPLDLWGPVLARCTSVTRFLNGCKSFRQSLAGFFPEDSVTTNVSHFLDSCENYAGEGMETWHTKNWLEANYTFAECKRLDPDLTTIGSNWTFTELLDAVGMFRNCHALRGIGFERLVFPSLFDAAWMFQNCYAFDADVSGWFPAGNNELRNIAGIFYGNANMSFRGTGVEYWDTSKVVDFNYAFRKCSNFANNAVANLDISSVGTNDSGGFFETFRETAIDADFSAWADSQAQTIAGCFRGCSNLGATTDPHIRLWIERMPNITSTRYLFEGCGSYNENFDNLNAPSTAFSKIIDTGHMFSNTGMWNNGDDPRLSNYPISWDFSNVTHVERTFYRCPQFNQFLDINLENVIYANEVFAYSYNYNQDLSHWRLPKANSIGGILRDVRDINFDPSRWFEGKDNDLYPLEYTQVAFHGCYAFNGDVSTWPMQNVVNMAWMFWAAKVFNRDISTWTLTNKLKTAFRAFGNNTVFNFGKGYGVGEVIDGSRHVYANGTTDAFANWDFSEVDTLELIFYYNHGFNTNLDGLFGNAAKVAKVENLTSIFDAARSFNNGANKDNPSDDSFPCIWEFPKVVSAARMFSRATRFRQSLRLLKLPKASNLEYMFWDNRQYQDRIGEIQYWKTINNISTMANFCNGPSVSAQMVIPTEDLNAIYLAWGIYAQTGVIQQNVLLHWGNSKYGIIAEDSRNAFINAGWVISGDSLEEP